MDARPAGRVGSGGRVMTLVVVNAVGLTPRALKHMPRTAKLGDDGFHARVGHDRPGGHLLGAVDVRDRPDADRPRHRRQRLVLPRPRRGLPLAPAQQARAGREGVGDRAPLEARLPRGEPVLVVRDGRLDGPDRHAAPDLPRRRPQVARTLHLSAAAARQPDRPAGRLPALSVLGPDGEHQVVEVDRRRGQDRARQRAAGPAAGLPAAPRLRPPALRPRGPGGAQGRARARRRRSAT